MTNGAVGIRFKGVDKVGYNHSDSYPLGLGQEVLNFLRGKTINKLREIYKKITVHDNADELDAWDWENSQFNNSFYNDECFLHDSLFCEYAYIINLDNKTLEIYEGFNRLPNGKGRYAEFSIEREGDGRKYYGVKLVKKFNLEDAFCEYIRINKNNEFFRI